MDHTRIPTDTRPLVRLLTQRPFVSILQSSAFNLSYQAPKDNTVTQEAVGEITSDSLAAESLKSGGDFAGGKATASSVPSKSTTANTTDTSAATVLPAAKDASSRDDEDISLGSKSGGSTSIGTQSGGSAGSGGSSLATGTNESSGTPSGEENFKPKGENLTEGGFDSDAPNASFNNDIGGKNDPGRVAESKFAAGRTLYSTVADGFFC